MLSAHPQKNPPFSFLAVGFEFLQNKEKDMLEKFNQYCDETKDNNRKAALYNDVAVTYFLLGNVETAMSYFKIATNFDPRCAEVQINQSIALLSAAQAANKNRDSVKGSHLNEAALARLNKVECTSTATHCRLGDVYKEYDQLSLARASYEKAISTQPTDTNDKIAYRKSMKALGRPEALKLYQAAYQQRDTKGEDHLEAHTGYQQLLQNEAHKKNVIEFKKNHLQQNPNKKVSAADNEQEDKSTHKRRTEPSLFKAVVTRNHKKIHPKKKEPEKNTQSVRTTIGRF